MTPVSPPSKRDAIAPGSMPRRSAAAVCTPRQYPHPFSPETYAATNSRSPSVNGDGPRRRASWNIIKGSLVSGNILKTSRSEASFGNDGRWAIHGLRRSPCLGVRGTHNRRCQFDSKVGKVTRNVEKEFDFLRRQLDELSLQLPKNCRRWILGKLRADLGRNPRAWPSLTRLRAFALAANRSTCRPITLMSPCGHRICNAHAASTAGSGFALGERVIITSERSARPVAFETERGIGIRLGRRCAGRDRQPGRQ